MFGRFKRKVPQHQQRLIRFRRVPKPNWYVGAAEHASVPRDPTLVDEIENLKKRLRDHSARTAGQHAQSSSPAGSPQVKI